MWIILFICFVAGFVVGGCVGYCIGYASGTHNQTQISKDNSKQLQITIIGEDDADV